ncbi:hypothetical protein E4U16_007817 [Claviceps sp. LM84 group G4]|nr:hypothetical protein E4U16_007817 [Claviceps sp. LM84 group G4]
MSTASQAHAQSPPDAEDGLTALEGISAEDQGEVHSVSSDGQRSTTSVTSSILDYRQLHGRTYHSDKFMVDYVYPNDDQQLESVELCHQYLTLLFDGQLYLAPLEEDKIHRVLDVGTGSGECEFADQFPNASVTGTDLSPCQPKWVPPNVHFEIDDASLDWTWEEDHFDFIHMRYIVGGIQDWTTLLKEAYRCCAPGGWVESIEYEVKFYSDDGTTELEPVLATFTELFIEAGKILNRPFFLQDIQEQAFDEAGFVEKKVIRYKLPVGPWAQDEKFAEVGQLVREAAENDLQGYTQMLWRNVLQRPAAEYFVWLATLRKAIRNPDVHSYALALIVYGRKPA